VLLDDIAVVVDVKCCLLPVRIVREGLAGLLEEDSDNKTDGKLLLKGNQIFQFKENVHFLL